MDKKQLPHFLLDWLQKADGEFVDAVQHPVNEDGHLVVVEDDREWRYYRVKGRYGDEPWRVDQQEAETYARKNDSDTAKQLFKGTEVPDEPATTPDEQGDDDAERQLPEYEVHELCQRVPRMAPGDYRALKASIEESGGLDEEAITLFEDRILDGRHRYEACRDLNIPLGDEQFVKFDGDYEDAQRYVEKQVTHRHLGKPEKAALAVSLFLPAERQKAEKRQQEGKDLRQNSDRGRATERAANKVGGISRNSVERMKHIKESAPAVYDDVMKGKFPSISQAEEMAKEDEDIYEEVREVWEGQPPDDDWYDAHEKVEPDEGEGSPAPTNASGENSNDDAAADDDEQTEGAAVVEQSSESAENPADSAGSRESKEAAEADDVESDENSHVPDSTDDESQQGVSEEGEGNLSAPDGSNTDNVEHLEQSGDVTQVASAAGTSNSEPPSATTVLDAVSTLQQVFGTDMSEELKADELAVFEDVLGKIEAAVEDRGERADSAA